MMYRTLALVAIVAASSVSVEARLNAGRGLQGKNNDKTRSAQEETHVNKWQRCVFVVKQNGKHISETNT